jgi:hypothetical protein
VSGEPGDYRGKELRIGYWLPSRKPCSAAARSRDAMITCRSVPSPALVELPRRLLGGQKASAREVAEAIRAEERRLAGTKT